MGPLRKCPVDIWGDLMEGCEEKGNFTGHHFAVVQGCLEEQKKKSQKTANGSVTKKALQTLTDSMC